MKADDFDGENYKGETLSEHSQRSWSGQRKKEEKEESEEEIKEEVADAQKYGFKRIM